jgi:hypothetical protein
MKACACSDSHSWAFVRDDLDAPDRVEPPSVVVDGVPAPMAYPGDGSPESLPYPTLPPIPPADGQPAPSPGGAPAPGTAPPPARPVAPQAPRKAPVPRRTEDTTFF